MDKLFYLTYAKKSARSNWNNYGRTDNKEFSTIQAHNLLNDCKKDTAHNWEVKVVTIYESVLDSKYDGSIPGNLKFNVYWPEIGMIPFIDMQSNTNQTIYNGGN